MSGCFDWLWSNLKDLAGLNSFNRWDTLWAITGGILCPGISTFMLGFWVEYGSLASSYNQEIIEGAVSNQDSSYKLLLFLSMTVIAPLWEEIIFRGWLWKLFEKMRFEVTSTLVLTSSLFIYAHIDVVHIVGVLPIGLFLGWLRWRSNSTIPTIICHAVNNSIAFILITIT
jgi:membrane protease YdiL (CAAX protease family)